MRSRAVAAGGRARSGVSARRGPDCYRLRIRDPVSSTIEGARVKKAIPGKDGFCGASEDRPSRLWGEGRLHMGKEWANLGPARSTLRFHTAKHAGQIKVKQWWCQHLEKMLAACGSSAKHCLHRHFLQ